MVNRQAGFRSRVLRVGAIAAVLAAVVGYATHGREAPHAEAGSAASFAWQATPVSTAAALPSGHQPAPHTASHLPPPFGRCAQA